MENENDDMFLRDCLQNEHDNQLFDTIEAYYDQD